MKLQTKISAVFIVALILNIAVIFFGLTSMLDSVSSLLMKKQAEVLTLNLQHRIAKLYELDPSEAVSSAASDFIMTKHIADESRGFEITKILLIAPSFKVQAGYPVNETGKSYETHEDIREAFSRKDDGMVTVMESDSGKQVPDIDVVSRFTLSNGSPLVIEMKLDFAKSVALLEAQYRWIETGAVASAILLLVGLLGVLLVLVGKTAVRPVIRVTGAMEKIGKGDLSVSLPEDSSDEFGLLARRFNEMVAGLREKLHLYSYVSRGTIDAVKEQAAGGSNLSVRRTAVIFFSDIRGFTSYSESRDPAAVVSVLNRILSLQSDIILRCGGDIDKFVGDEVMAVFTNASDALCAAVEIQEEMAAHSAAVDNLSIGIGIYEGDVIAGDVGSEKMRDHTIIGDSVNTAARLQSAASGGEIIVPQELAFRKELSGFRFEKKGGLKLKGKEKIITAYRVAG